MCFLNKLQIESFDSFFGMTHNKWVTKRSSIWKSWLWGLHVDFMNISNWWVKEMDSFRMDSEPNFAWAPRFSKGTDLHLKVLHQRLPDPWTLAAEVYAFHFFTNYKKNVFKNHKLIREYNLIICFLCIWFCFISVSNSAKAAYRSEFDFCEFWRFWVWFEPSWYYWEYFTKYC